MQWLKSPHYSAGHLQLKLKLNSATMQHGMRLRYGTVDLPAGEHEIRVIFFESGGGAGLEVSYAYPGVSRRLIPTSQLKARSAPSPSPRVGGFLSSYYNATQGSSMYDFNGKTP